MAKKKADHFKGIPDLPDDPRVKKIRPKIMAVVDRCGSTNVLDVWSVPGSAPNSPGMPSGLCPQTPLKRYMV